MVPLPALVYPSFKQGRVAKPNSEENIPISYWLAALCWFDYNLQVKVDKNF